MNNRKHRRFVSRFEHTCSTSLPSILWRIFTKNRSHRITRCRNTYKEFTLELLWTLYSLSCFRKNKHTQAHKFTEAAPLHRVLTRTRNNVNSQVRLLKYKWWTLWWSQHFDHLKSISQQLSYRNDIAMESSSVCEKNKDWFGGEKLKKSLLKTLDKLSFWFENIGSKTCGENHWDR